MTSTAPGSRSEGEALVDAIVKDFPDHQWTTRPVHAIGIGARGSFVANPVARRYSTAEHLSGAEIPVTVRFSNGSGSPVERDGAVDVRGMATKFHLPRGETDLIAMTLATFFVRTVEEFFAFTDAGIPRPEPRTSRLGALLDSLRLRLPLPDPGPTGVGGEQGLLEYADWHGFAQGAVMGAASVVTPASYARVAYHAVHAFRATAPDGTVRFVRLHWEPVAGVLPVSPAEALGLPADHLHTELAARLERDDARFELRAQVADAGDPVDDPTASWSDRRLRLTLGELRLTSLVPDQIQDCERLSFNPTRVVPGLECSDDPILAARRAAYEVSCQRRGGEGCPVR